MLTSATVLLSGGIDSALCCHLLCQEGHKVTGLFVDYGQPSARRERLAAEGIANAMGIGLRTARIEAGSGIGTGELRGRNALLVSTAVFHRDTEDGVVACGVHAGTPYYDCSPAFATTMGRLVEEQSDGRLRLVCPLLDMGKPEIIAAFVAAGLPLAATYSCESGDGPCGACASCLDRTALGC